MEDKKCVPGCKRFWGGEIKHHKDCPYYPESFSKMYDDLKKAYNEMIDYYERDDNPDTNEDGALPIQHVSERFLLIEWVHQNPILDGALYFDTKDECLEYINNLPKINGVDYTICRIRNVR